MFLWYDHRHGSAEGRTLERCADGPAGHDDVNVPDLNAAGVKQDDQHQRQERRNEVAVDHDLFTAPAVDERTDKGPEGDTREYVDEYRGREDRGGAGLPGQVSSKRKSHNGAAEHRSGLAGPENEEFLHGNLPVIKMILFEPFPYFFYR